MPSFLSITIAAAVAVLAVFFAFMETNKGEVPFDPPAYMMQLQDPPKQMHDGTDYAFGRFNAPVMNPNLRDMNFLERTLQRKEWSFNAVTDGRWLIGFAAVDLGYIETGFMYFLDTRSGSHDSWTYMLPANPSETNGNGWMVDCVVLPRCLQLL